MNKNANSADVRSLFRATTKALRKRLSLPRKSLVMTSSASRIRRSCARKMLRERIGVWEEDSIYWVKKSPSFDEKKVPWLFMKNHAFSPLCRVLEKRKLWPRGQKVFFVKRESFLIKSPLKIGGIFTFLFSQLCELRRKRVKKFFQYTTCVYEVVSPRLI